MKPWGLGAESWQLRTFAIPARSEDENESAFIRRLERAFHVPYGDDQLKSETRDMLLYGQLQEGLLRSLMRGANVSSALHIQGLLRMSRGGRQN